jgi:hypothetical protein
MENNLFKLIIDKDYSQIRKILCANAALANEAIAFCLIIPMQKKDIHCIEFVMLFLKIKLPIRKPLKWLKYF